MLARTRAAAESPTLSSSMAMNVVTFTAWHARHAFAVTGEQTGTWGQYTSMVIPEMLSAVCMVLCERKQTYCC